MKLINKALTGKPDSFQPFALSFFAFFFNEFQSQTKIRQSLVLRDDREKLFHLDKLIIPILVHLKSSIQIFCSSQHSTVISDFDNFLSTDNIRLLLQLVIEQYFKLINEDFDEWESDPEKFVADAEKEDWDNCARVFSLYSSLFPKPETNTKPKKKPLMI